MPVAIVTGSAGLVGSEASRRLHSEGFDVIGIDNDMRARLFGAEASTSLTNHDLEESLPNYSCHSIDIRDREGVDHLFSEHGSAIEIVIHAAAQPSHSGFEHRLPSQLSGGQLKRVAFARAISMDPEVLFCDEPSAGLDPRIGRGIDDLIRNLNRAFNMAICVVTHEMESVKVIADRITMLAPMPGGAQVVFSGTSEELAACDDPVVRDFVKRAPLKEPRWEPTEILKQLVGED